MSCRLVPALGMTALALPATAHQLRFPKADQIFVQMRRVLLRLWYGIPAGPQAQRLRRLFDRDGDGRLSESEGTRLRELLARMATHRLTLRLNGRRARLERWGAAAVGLGGAASSSAALGATVLVTARGRWRIGINRIQLRDRHPDAAAAVPAVLHLPPPFRFRWTSLGAFDHRTRQVTQAWLRPGVTWRFWFEAPRVIR